MCPLDQLNALRERLMSDVAVDDIDGAFSALEAAGGERLSEKMPIPTVGWSAFFRDTEGNRVGLFQADPTVGG